MKDINLNDNKNLEKVGPPGVQEEKKLDYPKLEELNMQFQKNKNLDQSQGYSGPVQTQASTMGPSEARLHPNPVKQSHIEIREPNVIIVERPVEPEIYYVERPYFYNEDYDFPQLSLGMAWLILIINILLPGIGTMIVSCLGVPNPVYFLLSGLFQLLTAYFIIGYILALWTSIALIIAAK